MVNLNGRVGLIGAPEPFACAFPIPASLIPSFPFFCFILPSPSPLFSSPTFSLFSSPDLFSSCSMCCAA